MSGREGEIFMHHRNSTRRNKLLRCQSSSKSNQKDGTIIWEYSGKCKENHKTRLCCGNGGKRSCLTVEKKAVKSTVIPLIHELFQVVLLIKESSALLEFFHKQTVEVLLFTRLFAKKRPKSLGIS